MPYPGEPSPLWTDAFERPRIEVRSLVAQFYRPRHRHGGRRTPRPLRHRRVGEVTRHGWPPETARWGWKPQLDYKCRGRRQYHVGSCSLIVLHREQLAVKYSIDELRPVAVLPDIWHDRELWLALPKTSCCRVHYDRRSSNFRHTASYCGNRIVRVVGMHRQFHAQRRVVQPAA